LLQKWEKSYRKYIGTLKWYQSLGHASLRGFSDSWIKKKKKGIPPTKYGGSKGKKKYFTDKK